MAAFAVEDLFLKRAAMALPPGQVIAMMGAGGALVFWALAAMKRQPILTRRALQGAPLIRALSGQARQLQMWSGLTPALTEQMLARELDMVICTETSVHDPRIAQRLLFSEPWVAVFPKAQRLPESAGL
mgnify:CR=1 FL=1